MTSELAPKPREEFVEWLRREGASRYHDQHPVHVRMHEGQLSQIQLQQWVLNRYYYQTRIPIKDAIILSKSEDPAFRRAWIRRIHDHDGDELPTADRRPHVRRSTTFVGVGGRVRVAGSTYLAAEIVPRVSGYAPDEPAFGVSIEKRVGAHVFSLTFTNTFGTTFAQVARGGAASTLYLGFNLGRKFY